MEFTTPARIYVNWEYDNLCPVLDRGTNLLDLEDFEDFDLKLRCDFMDPVIFPKMRRVAFVVDQSSVIDWPNVSERDNIEVILYPDFEALKTLKEDVFDARKQLRMDFVDFDDNMDEYQYAVV